MIPTPICSSATSALRNCRSHKRATPVVGADGTPASFVPNPPEVRWDWVQSLVVVQDQPFDNFTDGSRFLRGTEPVIKSTAQSVPLLRKKQCRSHRTARLALLALRQAVAHGGLEPGASAPGALCPSCDQFHGQLTLPAREQFAVCHCFVRSSAEATGPHGLHCLPCGKQWHTAVWSRERKLPVAWPPPKFVQECSEVPAKKKA